MLYCTIFPVYLQQSTLFQISIKPLHVYIQWPNTNKFAYVVFKYDGKNIIKHLHIATITLVKLKQFQKQIFWVIGLNILLATYDIRWEYLYNYFEYTINTQYGMPQPLSSKPRIHLYYTQQNTTWLCNETCCTSLIATVQCIYAYSLLCTKLPVVIHSMAPQLRQHYNGSTPVRVTKVGNTLMYDDYAASNLSVTRNKSL